MSISISILVVVTLAQGTLPRSATARNPRSTGWTWREPCSERSRSSPDVSPLGVRNVVVRLVGVRVGLRSVDRPGRVLRRCVDGEESKVHRPPVHEVVAHAGRDVDQAVRTHGSLHAFEDGDPLALDEREYLVNVLV